MEQREIDDERIAKAKQLFDTTARRLDCWQLHGVEPCVYCDWTPESEDHSHLIVDQRDASAKDLG